MPIVVKILGDGEYTVEWFRGMKVKDVLRKLKLLSSEYVVAKNGVIVVEDEEVSDGDTLVLYPVVSGG